MKENTFIPGKAWQVWSWTQGLEDGCVFYREQVHTTCKAVTSTSKPRPSPCLRAVPGTFCDRWLLMGLGHTVKWSAFRTKAQRFRCMMSGFPIPISHWKSKRKKIGDALVFKFESWTIAFFPETNHPKRHPRVVFGVVGSSFLFSIQPAFFPQN